MEPQPGPHAEPPLDTVTLVGPFIATLVLAFAFTAMWRLYREQYLGWWAIATGIWMLRYLHAFIGGTVTLLPGDMILPLLALGRGFFILVGGYALTHRPLPQLWRWVFVADLALLAYESFGQSLRLFGVEAFTHYTLYAVAMAAAGVLFVGRREERGMEHWIVGSSLVLIGILQSIFPFLAGLGSGWLTGTSAVLNFAMLAAGVGVMMVYFRRELREKQQLVHRLEGALARALSGYLPICAHCKRIRDDSGEWHGLEQYLSDRTDAAFTHGICPTCVEEHFPGVSGSSRASP